MNDRFKCRIWDKNQNKMLFPASNYNFCNINGVIVQVEIYENIVGNICAHIRKNKIYENAEFMQCTGSKDKNGKLIYEGDIVNVPCGNFIIKYCDSCKSFQCFYKDDCFACEGDYHWFELLDDLENLEVIGNIYENKELL